MTDRVYHFLTSLCKGKEVFVPRWNRREFLTANAASGSALAAQAGGEADSRPRVLITSALSSLARGLAGALNQKYRVRLTERTRM